VSKIDLRNLRTSCGFFSSGEHMRIPQTIFRNFRMFPHVNFDIYKFRKVFGDTLTYDEHLFSQHTYVEIRLVESLNDTCSVQ
jgi:hypothetical protein